MASLLEKVSRQQAGKMDCSGLSTFCLGDVLKRKTHIPSLLTLFLRDGDMYP